MGNMRRESGRQPGRKFWEFPARPEACQRSPGHPDARLTAEVLVVVFLEYVFNTLHKSTSTLHREAAHYAPNFAAGKQPLPDASVILMLQQLRADNKRKPARTRPIAKRLITHRALGAGKQPSALCLSLSSCVSTSTLVLVAT
jgi:hypothetical protein